MSRIKHTIISWDCSFRNFFHLVDGLLCQDYDPNEYELIFVEQREKKYADAYNHALGVPSLSDRVREVEKRLQFSVEYLGLPEGVPYHLGLCVNRALERARGAYISIMDGDQLVPPDFLRKLDAYHASAMKVGNLVRLMARAPVGVPLDRWKEGIVDFDRCLALCDGLTWPLPPTVANKGPMISAHRSAWEAINGYDPHPIWSTGLSRLGQDATARLELFCKAESATLPDCFAVHPYHPPGFSRVTLDSQRLLSIQADLIQWAREQRAVSWTARTPLAERLYARNQGLIKRMHAGRLSRPTEGAWAGVSRFGSSEWLGQAYRLARLLTSRVPLGWRLPST